MTLHYHYHYRSDSAEIVEDATTFCVFAVTAVIISIYSLALKAQGVRFDGIQWEENILQTSEHLYFLIIYSLMLIAILSR